MSEDVVTRDVALPEIRRLLGKLSLEATQDNGGRDAAMAIMESILKAETLEEAFDRQEAGTVSSKDFTLRPFRLLPENISWKKSASGYIEQGGFPFYALLRVTDMATGDEVVVDSGSPSVISILEKALSLDSFEPFRADGGMPLQFVGKPVSSGYSIVMLKPVAVESKPARGRR